MDEPITHTRERPRHQITFDRSKRRTQQAPANDHNINTIMARWKKGQQPPPAPSAAFYGDFSNISDFSTAQAALSSAQRKFDALSADVRKRFNHNPAELLAFAQDPNNLQEAVDLQLVTAPPPEPGPPAGDDPPPQE